jgi:choline-sulfatase
VHYVAYRPQLFDLARDPGEPSTSLAIRRTRRCSTGCAGASTRSATVEVDARAKRRQAELLARYGGREAALARGDLGFTPAPGTKPEMN